jgi:hypothetical protein
VSLTDLQKASFRQHIHTSDQIRDAETGDPIGGGAGLDGTSLEDYVGDGGIQIKSAPGLAIDIVAGDGAADGDAGNAGLTGGTGDDGGGGDGAQVLARGGLADGTQGSVDILALAVNLNGDPMATEDYADGAVSDHAAASNPHPTYLTQAEADALYSAAGAGFTNPMTTAGDMIYEGGGTNVARTATPSSPTGTAGGGGDPANVIDGDDGSIWLSGGEGVPNLSFVLDLGSAKAVASWREVLYATSGFGAPGASGTLLQSSPDGTTWTTQDTYHPGGADSGNRSITPTTARYWRVLSPDNTGTRFGLKTLDLFDAVVPARLAKGTTGQMLRQGATAPQWSAPFAIAPLDRTTVTGMHATFGDDFDGASLNARWSRVAQASGEESYQVGPRASAMRVAYSVAAASRYLYQAAPAGDWTFECKLLNWQGSQTGQMVGLVALDASGTGVASIMYDNTQGFILASVTTGAYNTFLSNPSYPLETRAGQPLWLRLRKASGVYYGSFSTNGETWSPEVSGTPTAFTLARIGIGRILGNNAADIVDWLWFDKTA